MKHLLLLIALSGFLRLTGKSIPNLNATEPDRKKAYEALLQDAEYLSALSTADRLLAAWITGESEIAEPLLSRTYGGSGDDMETFFASPSPRAFEIKHGRRVRPRTYEFPVVLLGPPAGNSRISVRLSTIVVSRAGGDRWAVEKLP
ncbi:MAG TPA: hypothetical protein VMG82_17425 [Candidatus Sulfotelmatobacter sp.]|nr:hypothetical protein [Candidatus Sulfotelmatobacter sp.]